MDRHAERVVQGERGDLARGRPTATGGRTEHLPRWIVGHELRLRGVLGENEEISRRAPDRAEKELETIERDVGRDETVENRMELFRRHLELPRHLIPLRRRRIDDEVGVLLNELRANHQYEALPAVLEAARALFEPSPPVRDHEAIG